jgi:hypothetical protein
MVAAGVALALVLAGCGGDDDGGSSAPEDVPSVTVEASGGGSTATTGADDGGDGASRGDAPFCAVDDRVSGMVDVLLPLLMGASADPRGMDDALDELYSSLDDLEGNIDDTVAQAPAEIRDDVRTMSEGIVQVYGDFPDRSEFEDALKQSATNPAAVQGLLRDLVSKYGELSSDPDFAEAQANVAAWSAANCSS